MKIIIDIPEGVYRNILEIPSSSMFAVDCDIDIRKGIQNGTPLPKGHGRLGDLDALEKEMTNGIKAGNYEEGCETFAHINDMDDCVECVKYADTIIEADKESEGEE